MTASGGFLAISNITYMSALDWMMRLTRGVKRKSARRPPSSSSSPDTRHQTVTSRLQCGALILRSTATCLLAVITRLLNTSLSGQ